MARWGRRSSCRRTCCCLAHRINGGGIDLNEKTDALASTANFLGAMAGAPASAIGPGEPNFAALQGWNAASVYQQALAIMGNEIDGN